jgi:hypothetical protein
MKEMVVGVIHEKWINGEKVTMNSDGLRICSACKTAWKGDIESKCPSCSKKEKVTMGSGADKIYDTCPRCGKEVELGWGHDCTPIKQSTIEELPWGEPTTKEVSDGSTASYYELPHDAKELQDLISAKNMNAQIGEIFRACYRYGQVAHSPEIRDIKKILFYANAELKRLEKLNAG